MDERGVGVVRHGRARSVDMGVSAWAGMVPLTSRDGRTRNVLRNGSITGIIATDAPVLRTKEPAMATIPAPAAELLERHSSRS